MTDLQLAYRDLRDRGRRHHSALRELARRYDLDPSTVPRSLDRANKLDQHGKRREQ